MSDTLREAAANALELLDRNGIGGKHVDALRAALAVVPEPNEARQQAFQEAAKRVRKLQDRPLHETMWNWELAHIAAEFDRLATSGTPKEEA